MKILSKLLLIAIAIHGLFLANFLLFHNFFQQDEWHGFGIMLSLKNEYVTLYRSPMELLLGDRFGARGITYTMFNFFKLNPIPYGLLAFGYHAINTFLVYKLSQKLTKQTALSLLAALFFLINEVGNEAYTWFGTMNGSAISVSFLLASLIFYLQYAQGDKKYRHLVFSLMTLWISFLFKEIASFVFLLYPIIFYIYNPNVLKNIKFFLKIHIPFAVFAIVIISYLIKSVLFIPGDRANYVATDHSFIQTLIIRIIQYPFEGFTQTILPNEITFKISGLLTQVLSPSLIPQTTDFDIAAQTTNAEIAIAIFSLIFFAIIFFAILKLRKNNDLPMMQTLIISTLMGILSFLPYIIINRSFSYFDSRYYYTSTVALSIVLAVLLYSTIGIKTYARKILLGVLIFGYIFMHESVLFSDIQLLSERASERQFFLTEVKQTIPTLKNKTVFYLTGDSGGYYGLEELKAPFQSGPGHVLMVHYTLEHQLSPDFFREDPWTKALDVGFLYDILGQGYREVGNQGFGYYYNKVDLQKDLDRKLFSENDIIALYYNSEDKKLKKIQYEK